MKKRMVVILLILLPLFYTNCVYGWSPPADRMHASLATQPASKVAAQSTGGDNDDVLVSDSSILFEAFKTLLYFLLFVLVILLFVMMKLIRKKKE